MSPGDTGRCACPACAASAAVLLLETDRPGMALSLMRGLPEAIETTVAAAHAAGVREGRGTRRLSRADELRRHVGRLGAARVAEVLGLERPADLGPLLEGRVTVARAALGRLRRAG